MRKNVKLYLFQILILASLVVVYDLTQSLPILITIIVIMSAGYIIYGLFFKIRPLPYLEKIVNPEVYMEYIENKVKKRAKKYYPLYKAYGLIYQNKIDEAREIYQLNQLKRESLDESLFRVDTFIQMHLFYDQNDEQSLTTLADTIEDNKHRTFSLGQSIEMFKHLIKENYYEAKELLMLIIPETKTRLHIVEMEYYLAVCYIKLNNELDALAVIDFMLEKDYPLFYTEEFKKLKEKFTKNEEV
ncbi:MAG: hypothetical protein K9L26_03785 [Candidatus Izimaplasma sp.]|nr:hypothetical protein [Candidatus Izimaplasma bacterium]